MWRCARVSTVHHYPCRFLVHWGSLHQRCVVFGCLHRALAHEQRLNTFYTNYTIIHCTFLAHSLAVHSKFQTVYLRRVRCTHAHTQTHQFSYFSPTNAPFKCLFLLFFTCFTQNSTAVHRRAFSSTYIVHMMSFELHAFVLVLGKNSWREWMHVHDYTPNTSEKVSSANNSELRTKVTKQSCGTDWLIWPELQMNRNNAW